jgi:hypothetical protein
MKLNWNASFLLFPIIFIHSLSWAADTNRFTLVVLPDTQHYVDNPENIKFFKKQTEWIVQNRDKLNIPFVTHEGDIVEHHNAIQEWETARQIMSTLDTVEPPVPYSICFGNHEKVYNSEALCNFYFGSDSGKKFGVTSFRDYPWWGGNYGPSETTENVNNYQLFSASGLNFVIIHLSYIKYELLKAETSIQNEADDSESTKRAKEQLRWADSILKKHTDRNAIIVTHCFLKEIEGKATRLPDTELLWNEVISPNKNVFLIMNGHELGKQAETCRSDEVNGHRVHQILANYQSRQNGGDGFLRLMEFVPAQKKIYVKTYSPFLDQFETDENSQFELDFNSLSSNSNYTRN